jgi:hypothetical protein
MMRPVLDADEVRNGLRVADAFWRALGRDDDDALADMLESGALANLGAGPGLGERIREHMDISTTMCACVGLVSPVLLAGDRRMRATYTLTSVPIALGRDPQGMDWCVEVVGGGHEWRVDPTASHHLREVAHHWVSRHMTWSRITESR